MLRNIRKSTLNLKPATSIVSTSSAVTANHRLFSDVTGGRLSIEDTDDTISSLRSFFKERGWKEVFVQHRRSILAACEDPWNIAHFDFEGERWPLPQTGQM